jgi:hypothetical protein
MTTPVQTTLDLPRSLTTDSAGDGGILMAEVMIQGSEKRGVTGTEAVMLRETLLTSAARDAQRQTEKQLFPRAFHNQQPYNSPERDCTVCKCVMYCADQKCILFRTYTGIQNILK